MTLQDVLAYYLIGATLMAGAVFAHSLMDGGPRGLLGWLASALIALAFGCAWLLVLLLIPVGLVAERRKPLGGGA